VILYALVIIRCTYHTIAYHGIHSILWNARGAARHDLEREIVMQVTIRDS